MPLFTAGSRIAAVECDVRVKLVVLDISGTSQSESTPSPRASQAALVSVGLFCFLFVTARLCSRARTAYINS